MFKAREKIIVGGLIILGLIVALKLFHIDYMVNYSRQPYKSFCNINETFNCDAVAASPYSRVLGVPIAFTGLLGNLFLFLFLFFGPLLKKISPVMKHIYVFIFGFYTLVCVCLAAISFFLMSSLCYVCMLYWLVSLATFAYLLYDAREIIRPFVGFISTLKSGLLGHKFVISGLLVLFLGINGCAGFILNRVGCQKVSADGLQCEHYVPETDIAYLGREGGKLDVVVYTDFQCPWCRRAHFALLDLVKKYEKQVRFVRKEFPLDMSCNRMVTRPFHDRACEIARLSKCAGRQGKYWAFHDEIYRNQEILSDDVFRHISKMLFLDWNDLKKCADSAEIMSSISAEIEEAIAYEVSGTPTFRIFGETFVGIVTEAAIQDYLQNYPAIKVDVLVRLMTKGNGKNIQIVDTREAFRYTKGHIGNAINFPNGNGDARLDPQKPTLLYDSDGSEINAPFNHFKELGYSSLHTLHGGYEAWEKEVGKKRNRDIK